MSGNDSFTYTIEDNAVNGESWDLTTDQLVEDSKRRTGRVEFVINPLNDAPSFTGAEDVTVSEDATTTSTVGLTVVPNFVADIVAGPAGAIDERAPNAQTVSFVVTPLPGNPAGLFVTTPSVSATGSLTFQTAPNANGIARFTIGAVDNGKTSALESNASPLVTFAINVSAVNDPPSFVAGNNVTVLEDSRPYTSPRPYATRISAGPADEVLAGQTVSFQVDVPTAAQKLFAVQPAINAAGTLTFTPAANAVGVAVVTVVAVDSAGATSPASLLTITITEVNDAPIASDFAVAGDEDSSLVVTQDEFLSLAVDPDLVSQTGEALTITSLPAKSTIGATISVDADGNIVYDPRDVASIQALKPGQTLADVFTYRLRDAGGSLSATARVTVNVAGRNDAPVSVADNAILVSGKSTVLRPLVNDLDIDGTIDPQSIIITTQPSHGTLTVQPDGTLVYTSEADYRGDDTIGYTVADNLGQQSEQAIITLNVAPLPTVPPAKTGSYIGEGVTIDLSQVPDPTGTLDPTTVTIVRPPSSGTVQVTPEGKISYTAEANFVGTDTFDFTIKDISGRVSEPITVTVSTVNSRLQNPVSGTDVNANGQTTALDALLIINYISRNIRDGKGSSVAVADSDRGPNYFDVDGNRIVSALDALRVINEIARISRFKTLSGEGEASLAAPVIQSVSTTLVIESAPVEPVWTDMVEDHAVATFQNVQPASDDLLQVLAAGQPDETEDDNDSQDLDLLDQVFSTF